MPSGDCGSFAQRSKCDITGRSLVPIYLLLHMLDVIIMINFYYILSAVNDLSHVNFNYLLAIIGVVLAVFPMLFCCSKGEKESSPERYD